MHAVIQWAEFVPVAPLLPALGEVAGYFVAFGLCIVAAYFVKALFGAAESGLGWIPWVGSAIKGSLHAIEQRLTNALGSAAAALDSRMALAWHKLASTASWMAHEIAANAGTLLALATVMTQPWNIPAWKQLYHSLVKHGQTVTRLFRAEVYGMLRPIQGELHALERWTYPKVRAAEHELGHVITHDIPGLRTRTRAIEDSLGAAWAKIKSLEGALATTAIAGAVAVALETLGASWIRCRNWNKIGKTVCGTGAGEIDALLGLLLGGAALLEFRELVKLAQSVEHGVAAGLQDIAKL